PLLLRHYRLLRVVLLLRNYALLVEIGVTLEVALRVLKVRLIFEFCGLGLRDGNFVRTGVDQGQFLSLPHLLTLTEVDLHQLAVNPAVEGYGVVSLNISQALEIHRNVALLHRSNRHRDGASGVGAGTSALGLRLALIGRLM